MEFTTARSRKNTTIMNRDEREEVKTFRSAPSRLIRVDFGGVPHRSRNHHDDETKKTKSSQKANNDSKKKRFSNSTSFASSNTSTPSSSSTKKRNDSASASILSPAYYAAGVAGGERDTAVRPINCSEHESSSSSNNGSTPTTTSTPPINNTSAEPLTSTTNISSSSGISVGNITVSTESTTTNTTGTQQGTPSPVPPRPTMTRGHTSNHSLSSVGRPIWAMGATGKNNLVAHDADFISLFMNEGDTSGELTIGEDGAATGGNGGGGVILDGENVLDLPSGWKKLGSGSNNNINAVPQPKSFCAESQDVTPSSSAPLHQSAPSNKQQPYGKSGTRGSYSGSASVTTITTSTTSTTDIIEVAEAIMAIANKVDATGEHSSSDSESSSYGYILDFCDNADSSNNRKRRIERHEDDEIDEDARNDRRNREDAGSPWHFRRLREDEEVEERPHEEEQQSSSSHPSSATSLSYYWEKATGEQETREERGFGRSDSSSCYWEKVGLMDSNNTDDLSSTNREERQRGNDGGSESVTSSTFWEKTYAIGDYNEDDEEDFQSNQFQRRHSGGSSVRYWEKTSYSYSTPSSPPPSDIRDSESMSKVANGDLHPFAATMSTSNDYWEKEPFRYRQEQGFDSWRNDDESTQSNPFNSFTSTSQNIYYRDSDSNDEHSLLPPPTSKQRHSITNFPSPSSLISGSPSPSSHQHHRRRRRHSCPRPPMTRPFTSSSSSGNSNNDNNNNNPTTPSTHHHQVRRSSFNSNDLYRPGSAVAVRGRALGSIPAWARRTSTSTQPRRGSSGSISSVPQRRTTVHGFSTLARMDYSELYEYATDDDGLCRVGRRRNSSRLSSSSLSHRRGSRRSLQSFSIEEHDGSGDEGEGVLLHHPNLIQAYAVNGHAAAAAAESPIAAAAAAAVAAAAISTSQSEDDDDNGGNQIAQFAVPQEQRPIVQGEMTQSQRDLAAFERALQDAPLLEGKAIVVEEQKSSSPCCDSSSSPGTRRREDDGMIQEGSFHRRIMMPINSLIGSASYHGTTSSHPEEASNCEGICGSNCSSSGIVRVDGVRESNKGFRGKCRMCCYYFFHSWECSKPVVGMVIISVLLTCAITMLSILLAHSSSLNANGNTSNSTSSANGDNVFRHQPTSQPTSFLGPNTSHPTFPPGTTRFDMFKAILQRQSADFVDLEALEDPLTPQGKALEWLANEDSSIMKPLSDWDALYQRYAVAVLFFAWGGENGWINEFQFLKDMHECGWRGKVVKVSTKEKEVIDGGVLCDESDTVREVVLSRNNMTGTIPKDLSLLSNLHRLELYSNKLMGPIPISITTLQELRELDLSLNELSGTLPSSIGSLSNLTGLWCEFNGRISGKIPSSLGKLTRLKWMSLASNSLSGTIPYSLGDMKSLKLLEIGLNNLEGSIPKSIYKLRTLENLNVGVQNTGLSGGLEIENGDLPELRILSVWGNKLSGTLPSSLGSMSKIQWFLMNSNQFTGSIPQNMMDPKNLTFFSLSDNLLSGSIPNAVGNLRNLEWLYIYSNNLIGTIPESLGNNRNLGSVVLYDNNLNGTIPSTLTHLDKMWAILLHSNELIGTIPSEMGSNWNLRHLQLADNFLDGVIPESISNLSKLELLSLARNDLVGNLNFLCDKNRPVSTISWADCSEVTCDCCTGCCSDGIGDCDINVQEGLRRMCLFSLTERMKIRPRDLNSPYCDNDGVLKMLTP